MYCQESIFFSFSAAGTILVQFSNVFLDREVTSYIRENVRSFISYMQSYFISPKCAYSEFQKIARF